MLLEEVLPIPLKVCWQVVYGAKKLHWEQEATLNCFGNHQRQAFLTRAILSYGCKILEHHVSRNVLSLSVWAIFTKSWLIFHSVKPCVFSHIIQDQSRLAASRKAEKDVHMIWKDLHEKCISDKVLPPSPPPSLPGLPTLPDGDVDLDDGAGFSPLHASNDAVDDTWGSPHRNNGGDGVAWGDSPVVRDDDGGWGAVGKGNDSNEVDGYDQDNSTGASKELSGWSKPASERSGWGAMSDKEGSSRNAWDDFGKEDRHEGWGDGATEPINEGGWGSLNNEEGMSGKNLFIFLLP